MRFYLKNIIILGSFLLISILFSIGFAAYRSFATLEEKNYWVQHTYQVILESEKILSLVKDAQVGQRGYSITGDSLYLAPFFRSVDSSGYYIQRLKNYTADNQLQQVRIDSLANDITHFLNRQKNAVLMKARGQSAALQQMALSHAGNIGLSNIDSSLQTIMGEENKLLVERANMLDATFDFTRKVVYIVILGCAALILLLLYTLIQQFNKKEKIQQALHQANQELQNSNHELLASNEELHSHQEELFATVEQLEQIKNELEKMVAARTADLQESNYELLKEVEMHKRTESALRKSEERFRVALENSQMMVFHADKNLRYTWVHNAKIGFGQQDVLGKADEELMAPGDALQVMGIKRKVFESGKGIREEIKLSGDKNRNIYFIISIEPLTNASGEVVEITGAAYNITEQKLAEKKLEHTLKELQKRNHELDNYVYKVSHDLRSPLTSILGLINLIQAEPDPDTVRKYVDMIENRANKLDDFIKSVLNHSKAINSALQVKQIDFKKLIADTTEELKYLPDYSKINIREDIQEAEPFFSDELRISILLKNFISNAIKYLNPGAEASYLHIAVQVTAQEAKLSFADNGIGISEAYVKKVFDMFFRATQSAEGSGLGLYIVKQTVEKLGGTIEVESKLNTGTTFRLTIPNLKNNTPAEA